MSRYEKTLRRVLSGARDAEISFSDLCNLLLNLGFENRIKGSHHIFYRQDVEEILNLQPKKSKAKLYQVKQVRQVILKYGLGGDIDV